MLELRSVELFYGGIESIAIDVDDNLTEVSFQLQLDKVIVGTAQLCTQIEPFDLLLLLQDLVDLVGEVPVLDFLIVEKLAALAGIVDDLGDLLLIDGVLTGLCERRAEEVVLERIVLVRRDT